MGEALSKRPTMAETAKPASRKHITSLHFVDLPHTGGMPNDVRRFLPEGYAQYQNWDQLLDAFKKHGLVVRAVQTFPHHQFDTDRPLTFYEIGINKDEVFKPLVAMAVSLSNAAPMAFAGSKKNK